MRTVKLIVWCVNIVATKKSNPQILKCLFGFHDWVHPDTGEYWSDNVRRCKNCRKKHPDDLLVYDKWHAFVKARSKYLKNQKHLKL